MPGTLDVISYSYPSLGTLAERRSTSPSEPTDLRLYLVPLQPSSRSHTWPLRAANETRVTMPADRMLNTVLQYYQDVHDAARTDQIIGTTAHLLAQLSNPLNLGVLTSQLLTARAIWQRPEGLQTSVRVISIYHTAATRVHEHETAEPTIGNPPREGGGLQCDEWTRAVVKGADDRSKRWQHLLVLTGVLMGMEGNDKRALSRSLRNTLEGAVVTAANLALESHVADGPLAAASIVLALNFAFPLLSDSHRTQINSDALLPLTIWAVTGEEGFADAHFLEAIGRDTNVTPGNILNWPAQSPSFQMIQVISKQPLIGNIGPLSKLAGFAVQHAKDTRGILQAHESLLIFSRRVLDAWQRTPYGDLDPALEGSRLNMETQQETWPVLWQVLRKLVFGVVGMLQSIVSRSLLDPVMYNNTAAPGIASKSLHILRHLHFISSRDGNGSFQVYTFAYMTSIDVISRFAAGAQAFLEATRPGDPSIPTQYVQRSLDLFYLNLAEHLPLTLSTEAAEEFIVKPALAYLSHQGPMTPSMVELFESAHSCVLAVLCCPQHSSLTIGMAPFYIVKLFESFPTHISSRQFRMAFKTVMQVVSPPFPIAAMEPHLSETLLEMLRTQITNANTTPLPQEMLARDAAAQANEDPLSQQSGLAMALVDSLPFLPLPLVEEWLSVAAQALNEIEDPRLREPVKTRFWDILVSGEMDVERAAIGVAWWGTKGGRELVLYGRSAQAAPMMSGALVGEEHSSKL